jgi:hypothetical protein
MKIGLPWISSNTRDVININGTRTNKAVRDKRISKARFANKDSLGDSLNLNLSKTNNR